MQLWPVEHFCPHFFLFQCWSGKSEDKLLLLWFLLNYCHTYHNNMNKGLQKIGFLLLLEDGSFICLFQRCFSKRRLFFSSRALTLARKKSLLAIASSRLSSRTAALTSRSKLSAQRPSNLCLAFSFNFFADALFFFFVISFLCFCFAQQVTFYVFCPESFFSTRRGLFFFFILFLFVCLFVGKKNCLILRSPDLYFSTLQLFCQTKKHDFLFAKPTFNIVTDVRRKSRIQEEPDPGNPEFRSSSCPENPEFQTYLTHTHTRHARYPAP